MAAHARILFCTRHSDGACSPSPQSQQATLIRAQTAFEVATIENQATLVTQTAAAEAQKIRALASNAANKRIDAARAEGLQVIAVALGIHNQSELLSLDYIATLVESNDVTSFVGMPATLQTAATQP